MSRREGERGERERGERGEEGREGGEGKGRSATGVCVLMEENTLHISSSMGESPNG